MADIGMVIRQLAGLCGDCLVHFGLAIPDVDTIQAGKGIQQTVAIAVLNVTALAAGHDTLRDIAPREFGQMCGRVEKIFAIPLFQ